MISTALFLALQFITTQSYVFDDGRIIRQASELVPWCKAKAEYHYMLKGMQTFQWTASHYSRTNELHVDGKIRVHSEDVVVRCRMTSGEREATAVIEIDDP
jgi:hypothetical protein